MDRRYDEYIGNGPNERYTRDTSEKHTGGRPYDKYTGNKTINRYTRYIF